MAADASSHRAGDTFVAALAGDDLRDAWEAELEVVETLEALTATLSGARWR